MLLIRTSRIMGNLFNNRVVASSKVVIETRQGIQIIIIVLGLLSRRTRIMLGMAILLIKYPMSKTNNPMARPQFSRKNAK
jgi:hypothetical protein